MAKAYKTETPVQTMVPGIQLNLTMEEAQFLRDVLSLVGGYQNTRRGLGDAISNALTDFGIYAGSLKDVADKERCIRFINT
jgi:hypothetical protein